MLHTDGGGLDKELEAFVGVSIRSDKASDSGARAGFETYLRRVVSLSKTLYSPKYW